ncbi:MAG TPA: Gfo/Idh/MocA family oxidoreductase [Anaerolineae bacterium]|nr:Gfo/Idh/MocA family oxidoreductase [Anaerolineae bacterium]
MTDKMTPEQTNKQTNQASTQPTNRVAPQATTPRLALVGCGAIAEQYYLPALARHPAVLSRLVLVDRDRARAEELAKQFSVGAVTTDYRDIVHEVDGAILAVPTHLHNPIGLEFLSNGVHVFSEKPLAESADKAREMVTEAERAGVVLAANYQRRLFPPLAKVKELLDEGGLGAIRSITYRVGEKYDWQSKTDFRFQPGTVSGGVLRDRGAHVMYVISWWLGGKPEVVSSENDSLGGPEAVARVRFQHNGAGNGGGSVQGDVLLSWLSKFPTTFQVELEGGTLWGDIYDNHSIVLKQPSGREKRIRLDMDGAYHAIADGMITNFLDAMSSGTAPLVSGRDALPSIQFIDECYRAARRFDMPWYDVKEMHNA